MRIKNFDTLISHGNVKGRKIIAQIIDAALTATNPYDKMFSLISVKDNKLIFDDPEMETQGDPRKGPAVYDLNKTKRIFVFAVGKGILYAVKPLEEILGDYLTGGYAVPKHGDDLSVISDKIKVRSGRHPVPDAEGIQGCREMMEMIASLDLTGDDLCITVMGNGCSALACLPDDSISVEEVEAMNQLTLIDNGMTTEDVSYLRNSIDQFRGGRVMRAMRPAQIVNLCVVNPEPIYAFADKTKTPYEIVQRTNMWIPNRADCTTPAEAVKIAKALGVFDKLSESIQKKLLADAQKGTTTVHFDEYESWNARSFATMPGNRTAVTAGIDKAKELGLNTYVLHSGIKCESAPTGTYVGRLIRTQSTQPDSPFKTPCVLFGSGELIVTTGGENGIGGTNQEFCCAAAISIEDSKRVVIGAIDTDGTDGPGGDFHPDATAQGINCLTGGIVDGYTMEETREKGVDLSEALRRHDTSQALWRLDSGIAAVQDTSNGDFHCYLIMDEDG